MAEEMDILPHQIIHWAGLGQREKVYQSRAIWQCAGCHTCAMRCPNGIDVTEVIEQLRREAIEKGPGATGGKAVVRFHEIFLKNLSKRGRINELGLMGKYQMATGRPFHNMKLAPKMLRTGRLRLLPGKAIKGFRDWFAQVWKQKKLR